MDITAIVETVSTLGFPIACVVALGFFLYKIYNDTTKREDRLYEIIGENRKVNAEAISTIAKYAEKLEVIQNDVNEIKTDITIITGKIGS